MTDTHTHLYMDEFDGAVVDRAVAAGVDMMVFPNVDMSSIEPVRRLHKLYPRNTVMGMGIHPTELGADWRQDLVKMEELLRGGEYAAVGEVGIDLHWPDSPDIETQKEAFAIQLEWGCKYDLPVIIHSRDAREETLEVIAARQGNLPVMIFHSFTGTPEDVKRIREVCDPWFGINGVVTFKNAPELREAVSEIGADRLLLETDAPYLAPVPYRGSRNESAYLPKILEACAARLGMTSEALEKETDQNARRAFRL